MNPPSPSFQPLRPQPHLRILGTRGIVHGHGGFESFAEDLALYLVDRGWRVTVYCQEEGDGGIREDEWRSIRLVHIPVHGNGSLSTVVFDWKSTQHALKEDGLALVLGYNTAIFSALYKLAGTASVMNMDGLEWKRGKYGLIARAWFWCNERLGCWFSDALVADHPEIARHLATRGVAHKIRTIAYGARCAEQIDRSVLAPLGLHETKYALVIARPEPENSILEIVQAFDDVDESARLVVLGHYSTRQPYQRAVLRAAGPKVLFPGGIYDHKLVDALRRHASLYVHGHTVGGTNPALVEALGAGVPVLAHDNRFNRWVAAGAAAYFTDGRDCSRQLSELLRDDAQDRRVAMGSAAAQRHAEAFVLHDRLAEYESLLRQWAPSPSPVPELTAVATV